MTHKTNTKKRDIVPAVLPGSFYQIEDAVEKVRGTVDCIQIDFVDGRYAPSVTWPYTYKDDHFFKSLINEEMGLPAWEEINYEFDLMIQTLSLSDFQNFCALGPARIVFHTKDVSVLETYAGYAESVYPMVECGIALCREWVPEDILLFKDAFRFIQCMGIRDIGIQRQPFDETVIPQIQAFREAFGPDYTISVDGSVNKATAQKLLDAGASRLVIGSAVFSVPDAAGEVYWYQSV
jgi:ribulose-phosphate 3-epimerase